MSSEHLKICPEAAALFAPEDFCPYTGELVLTLWRGLAEFTVVGCRFCLFCGAALTEETEEAVITRPRRASRRPDLQGASPAVRRAYSS